MFLVVKVGQFELGCWWGVGEGGTRLAPSTVHPGTTFNENPFYKFTSTKEIKMKFENSS